LIERAFAGDPTAFELVVSRYQAALYHFIVQCLGNDEQADDVVQFVFLQLYLSIPKLLHTPFFFAEQIPLKFWLFRVARNRSRDELRKKRSVLFSELEPVEEEDGSILDTLSDPSPLPEEVAEQEDLRERVCFAIQSLPPKFRSIVFLRYKEELSFGEIGHRLNIPQSTAKTYFQRARPLLRALLNAQAEVATVS
jgi:RNA polymerase sigma-70 factor (ECF subfamily)